ncbi:kinase-like domain-containing protein [Mycena amicta]|nr:kinase-like domain-containing protein [Mycena amicta]
MSSDEESSDTTAMEQDSGFYYHGSGTWWKLASVNEQAIHRLISPHPRILQVCEGSEELDDYLELEYHPRRDLWVHLVSNQDIPLLTRVDWAVEIAEGLAHLHSKSVIWADAQFGNVLVTDDDHVVLADFAHSTIQPFEGRSRRNVKLAMPPHSVFRCPEHLHGCTYVDVFGFGVMLFALLGKRFPWTEDLTPAIEEHARAANNHRRRKFDVLEDRQIVEYFGEVLDGCFNAKYSTGRELLYALQGCRQEWQDAGMPSSRQ